MYEIGSEQNISHYPVHKKRIAYQAEQAGMVEQEINTKGFCFAEIKFIYIIEKQLNNKKYNHWEGENVCPPFPAGEIIKQCNCRKGQG